MVSIGRSGADPPGIPGQKWRVRRGPAGLRLDPLRSFGSEQFTWVDLLGTPLPVSQVYVLYFPSRFELPVDNEVREALRIFGTNTADSTSVEFWDPRDRHFQEALAMFDLQAPPALVLAAGLPPADPGAARDRDSMYSISFTDTGVLSDRALTAVAVNFAHEILSRCDRREIATYLRNRRMKELLLRVGEAAGLVRDQILKLRPKFGLPGGASLQLG
jgi:hypothetical protein